MTSSLFVRRFLVAPCALAAHLCLARAGLAQQSLAPAPFPVQEDVEASDEAYRRGNAASHDKRWADAYEAYRQAWSRHRSMKVAANLGNLELTEGKNRDAAEHLGFAVYAYPKDGDPGVLATLKERLVTAKAKVGTLHVAVSGCPQADVFVDGVRLGMSIDGAIFVEPGTRTVEARWEGCRTARQAIDIAAGATRELPLDMMASAPVVVAPPPVARPEERPAEPRAKNGLALGLGFGGAAVAATVGAWFAVGAGNLASVAAGNRNAVTASYGRAACASPSGQAAVVCGEVTSAVSTQAAYTDAAIGSLVAAGVLALGTGAYALWPVKGEPTKATLRVRVQPLVTGDRRVLVAVGSF
jgi:hypothetical protein